MIENLSAGDAKSADAPWYAKDGLRFTCTQCGNCCTGGPGYVWISDEEIRRLAEHLKLSVSETLKRHCWLIGKRISLKEHRVRGMYDCEFLKQIETTRVVDGQTVAYAKRVCTIYPVRPLQCRTWPFWDEIVASPKSWAAESKRKCPGMDDGKRWSLEEIERIRTARDWPDRAPGSKTEP